MEEVAIRLIEEITTEAEVAVAVLEVVVDVVEVITDAIEEVAIAEFMAALSLMSRMGVVTSTKLAAHLTIPVICCIW